METQFILLTLKSLYRRRKFLRLPVILCSNTLATMVLLLLLYSTIQEMTTQSAKKTYGSWNFAVYNASEETLDQLQDNALVQDLGIMTIYGSVVGNTNGKTNYIGSVDDTARLLMSTSFEQGRYPETATEIALEKELLLALGIDDTLGSKVVLAYSDGKGTTKELTFSLCGIINSYHNTYLKQGPMVSAFLCTSYSPLYAEPLYKNSFLTLADGYSNASIVRELHASTLAGDTDSSENWYYNTYIETYLPLHYATLFIMTGIGLILLATIYHSFLSYYTTRYQTLTASQILVLDKKKISRIFHIEAAFLFPLITVLGCLKGALFAWILYKFYSLFISDISIHVPKWALLLSLLLPLLCINIVNLISRIHSYSLTTRQPVVHLPSISVNARKKQYHRFPYILKRIILVYKRSLLQHIICYTVAIATIFIFSSSAYYTYQSVQELRIDTKIDYSITELQNIKSISKSLRQIKKLSEVESISYYQYVIIDSMTFIEVSDTQTAPPTGYCYLYVPSEHSRNSLPITNNRLMLSTLGKDYALNIIPYDKHSCPNMTYTLVNPSLSYVYCNSEVFQAILSATGRTSFHYIGISYCPDADYLVATNMIDTLLFGKTSFLTIQNMIENDKKCGTLLINEGIVTILCLFTFLTSFMILKNQQKAGLLYLKKEIKILWSLGFEKNSLRLYLLVINLICIAISSCIAFGFVYCFYHWRIESSNLLYPYMVQSFSITPNLLLLSFLLLLFYSLTYLSYLTKDINAIIEKF